MGKNLKICLHLVACALIGLGIAFRLSRNFWWVGLIAGGLLGFFTYDFRAVRFWARHHARELREMKVNWPRAGRMFGLVILWLIDMFLWAEWHGGLMTKTALTGNSWQNAVMATAEFFSFVSLLVGAIGIYASLGDSKDEEMTRLSVTIVLRALPPVLFVFTIPYYALKASVIAGAYAIRFAPPAWRFAAKVSAAICTDARLTASFSIALSIAIGYASKSYLAGSIAAPSLFFAARWASKRLAVRDNENGAAA